MRKITIALATIFLSLIFFTGTVRAASDLSVSPNSAIFEVKDAAPGGEYESEEITVKNKGEDKEKIQFEIKVKTNPEDLGELLYLKVINKEGDCVWDCSYKRSLNSLDNKEIEIRSIKKNETKKYRFVILFDKNAGNEFQDARLTFNIKIGFKGSKDKNSEGGNGNEILAALTGAGGVFPGAESGGQSLGVETENGINSGEPGEVAGESDCAKISWLIFFLMLLAYLLIFNINLWHKFRDQERPRWFWEVAFTALAIIAWYYFDACRTNGWFVYAVVILGFINYLAYLYYFKKKLKVEETPPDEE